MRYNNYNIYYLHVIEQIGWRFKLVLHRSIIYWQRLMHYYWQNIVALIGKCGGKWIVGICCPLNWRKYNFEPRWSNIEFALLCPANEILTVCNSRPAIKIGRDHCPTGPISVKPRCAIIALASAGIKPTQQDHRNGRCDSLIVAKIKPYKSDILIVNSHYHFPFFFYWNKKSTTGRHTGHATIG